MRFLKFICIIFMLGMLMPQGVFAQSKNLFGKVYMMTKNGKTGIYNKEHKKWYMEQIYDSIVGVGATYYCFEYSLDYDYAGYSNGSITLAECPGSKNPITNLQDYEYLGEGKSCHGLALKRNNKWAWIPGSKTSSVADAETISYEFDSLAPFKPLNPISLDHFLIGYKNGYMNLYDDYTKDKLIDAEQIISVSPIFSPFFNTWEGKADAIMIKNTANLLGITVLGPRHYIKPTTLAPQYHRIEIDTLKSYMYCTNLDKNVLDVYSFLLRVGSSMKFTREYTTTADGINSFFAFKEEQAQQEQLKKAIQDSIETKNKIRMGEERKAYRVYVENGLLGLKNGSGTTLIRPVAGKIDFMGVSYRVVDNKLQVFNNYTGTNYTVAENNCLMVADANRGQELTHFYPKVYIHALHKASGNYFDYPVTISEQGAETYYTVNSNIHVCPVCNNNRYTSKKYVTVSDTIRKKEVVEDGVTTITKKNYLANERVTANGTVYVPTYEEKIQNYKTIETERVDNYSYWDYETCYICEGRPFYLKVKLIWDYSSGTFIAETGL